ncbi:MAG: universal stress protein [Nitrospirales bacterium]|nr:universal stress protein [Nitrospira sp.]MDR4502539.1 universal stress protein [Nitrospirales bacterium]
MTMKILLGVDFSRDSKAAIRFLSTLRFPAKSELFFVHVIRAYHEFAMLHAHELEDGISVLQQKHYVRAQRHLTKLAEQFVDPALQVQTVVQEGNPGREILALLEQEQCHLAVLGTRGLSSIERFLLGSVSEWVLQEAPCSILVVRGSGRRGKRGWRVLVATDGSSEAQAALEMLNTLQFPPASEVFVFHVVEGTDYRVVQDDFRRLAVDASGQVDLADIMETIQMRKEVEGLALVKEAKKGLFNRHGKQGHISSGHAAEEILRAARRFRADLIVMGSRGLTGLKRQFLGSVSTRVARHAECSVLVVRRPKKDSKALNSD